MMILPIERRIMAGLGMALLFIVVLRFILFQSTARLLDSSNQLIAVMDRRAPSRDVILTIDNLKESISNQVGQMRGIGTVTGLVGASAIAIAAVLIHVYFRGQFHAEEQLRQNEERFRLLVERAKEYAIFRLDTQGRVESWNAGAQRIKGYEAKEIIGQNFSRFFTPEAIEAGEPEAELQIALKTGQFQSDGWRLRKDGSRFWGNVIITPLRDGRGNHIGFSEIFRDLSDQRQAEEAIAELNKTLRKQNLWLIAANGEMEAFSYSVSHDLRAPLRSLSGFSQALLEDYGHKMDADCQIILNRISAASQRMGQLIDGLLDLSRVTRVDMCLEKVDLTKIALEISQELKRDEPERVAEFTIADGLKVEGDPRLLRVLLTNLLGNAWKFTARQAQARIEFGRFALEGHETFFVRDNGVGFDMTYSSKLFHTFQRLHSTSEFAGTGIGLATVNRIVHRYGGRVWGQGKVEKGAVFYFTLQPGGEGRTESDAPALSGPNHKGNA